MSLPKTRPLKTVADYLSLDDERRVELIAGDFFVTPSPTCRHQRIVGNVSRALDEHVRARSLGEVYFAPHDVAGGKDDVEQPDVLFVSSGRTEIFQDRVRGVPDLLVEVVSDSGAERDRIVKRDL
ncbi:MAG: Uma2 family endonuclease, partial [Planctomycetota bacterium]|nr:Uma2 family endonuclease [Planctomycetota bacterium]